MSFSGIFLRSAVFRFILFSIISKKKPRITPLSSSPLPSPSSSLNNYTSFNTLSLVFSIISSGARQGGQHVELGIFRRLRPTDRLVSEHIVQHASSVISCSSSILCYTALHCTAMHCSVLYCTVLYCTALHCTALHCTALHCTVLHCTALYCTALHCTALHCTALYCTVLHCTVLYFIS